jgi:hypothetical protein
VIRRHLHAAALAAAAALLAVPSLAFAGAGEGVGYRLEGGPGSTLEQGFIRLPAAPGSTVSARFIASNTTSKPVNVTFFGADGATTRATGVVFGSSNASEVGQWIAPSRSSATLPAGSEVPIDVAVSVPPGASGGDHVGAVIMAQQDGASTKTVTQVVRYAIPLLIDVAGGSGAQVTLGTSRMGRIGDVVTVVMPLRNGGSRICRPVVSARVSQNGGTPVTVEQQLDEILPGDQINYPLRLPAAMPAGQYLVRADVTGCGAAQVASTTATLGDDSATTSTATEPNSAAQSNDSDAITPVPLKSNPAGAPTGSGHSKGKSTSQPTISSAAPSTATPAPSKAAPTSKPASKPAHRSWISRAADTVAANAPGILKRGTLPLGAGGLVGLLLFFQHALDRRDPKLVGAPRDRERDLTFDPNPLHP